MEVDTVLSDFESSDFGEMVRKHTSTAVKHYILLYPFLKGAGLIGLSAK